MHLLMFDDRRMRIKINIGDEELKKLFNKWKETYHVFQFNGFKHYWNYYNQDIFLYPDRKYNFWDKEWHKEKDISLLVKAFEKGIYYIIENYKKLR